MQRVGEEAHRIAVDAKIPEAQRTRATEREQAASSARQQLASQTSEARKLVDEMDQRIKALREKYEATFGMLRQNVESRIPRK